MMELDDLVQFKEDDNLDGLMGWVRRIGTSRAQVDFFKLPWTVPDKELPQFKDFTIEKLKPCPEAWKKARIGEWEDFDKLIIKTQAAELWMANSQGQLGNAKTDPYPHQICLVHELLSRNPCRVLIAEEVGMGKTIETGMFIHALIGRGLLRRCLIICPAGQIKQWQEELSSRFNQLFDIYKEDVMGERAFNFSKIIASIDTVKLESPIKKLGGKSHKEILLNSENWDLIVFDEAHRLSMKDYGQKRDKTFNYRLAEELSKRTQHFIFLTGTPHDGNDTKFRNLLRALEPSVSFENQNTATFFGKLVLKNQKSKARDADGELIFKPIEIRPVLIPPNPNLEVQFHEQLVTYLKEGYGYANRDLHSPQHRAIGFVMTTFQKLASSSTHAVKKALIKRLDAIMKKSLGSDGNDKKSEPLDCDERFSGEMEESQIDALSQQSFADIEISILQQLVQFPEFRDAKFDELKKILANILNSGPEEKIIIFSEYRGTVSFLEKELEALYGKGCCQKIIGGIGPDGKRRAIDEFRGNPIVRFLLSTEAGGEGINLQFSHIAINYDLPWNPFRLLQRYGRVHRIGQQKKIEIFNLRLKNHLDEKIESCYEERLASAVNRLSEITNENEMDIRNQLIGFAQEFLDYEKIYQDALLSSNIKSSEQEILEGIQKAEEAFKLAYFSVFQKAITPFNPERFKKIINHTLSLDNIREWVDHYLKNQGRKLMFREESELYEFIMPDNLKYKVPSDRRHVAGIFDRNRAITNPKLELFAFGNSSIEILFRSALAPNFGGLTSVVAGKDHEYGVLVFVIIKTADHEGVSAFQYKKIFWNSETRNCCFWDRQIKDYKENLEGRRQYDFTLVKESIIAFLKSSYPEIEFIEEKFYWLAICQIT